MTQPSCNTASEQMYPAMQDKIASAELSPSGTDGQSTNYSLAAYDENGQLVTEAIGAGCDATPTHEAYNMHQSHETYSRESYSGQHSYDQGHQHADRNRKNRVRDRDDRPTTTRDASSAENEAANQYGTVNFTTVMFRNIPNKYTREMLVKQLDQDFKGQFDFVYLPIDFKNRCNVGYAFINFRSVEACEVFVNRFNGMEVRKCLPGLNSRKVTEVTPARVQGFDENVQRLRNSPVMRELIHKPEWMPLIFDYNGDQIPFPSPERPLEPIKPRRRARDDEARLL